MLREKPSSNKYRQPGRCVNETPFQVYVFLRKKMTVGNPVFVLKIGSMTDWA